MKVKTMSALAGLGGALIMSSAATAAPFLTVVSSNTTNAFLVANNLQSAVVGITGFASGENFQGMIGTAANPWSITAAGGFFNIGDDYPYFDGQGQTAATAASAPNFPGSNIWDTGVLANATTNALGAITTGGASTPIGFAQAGGSGNTGGTGADVFWLTLNANGLVMGATTSLFRLTWSRSASADLHMLGTVNTGGGNGYDVPLRLTIPAVPAPGALALLGLAGVVGSRRRRA